MRVVELARGSRSDSTSRPTCASVCSANAAYTSISRSATSRSASESSSQCGTPGVHGASSASGGTTPSSCCRCEGELALPVPAVRELAAVLVGPALRHLERRVRRAEGEVGEPRLVRRVGADVAHPVLRLVDEVLGQVVALGRGRRRVDERRALDEGGLELARLATEEAVEAVEALAGRPAVERARRRSAPTTASGATCRRRRSRSRCRTASARACRR